MKDKGRVDRVNDLVKERKELERQAQELFQQEAA